LILRNCEVVYRGLGVAGGEQVTFDDTDALGICHYSVVSYDYEYMGDVRRDTILNGPTCEMTFQLHDSIGDGWLVKSISIVDSRGNAITRLGLTEGSEATVVVDVPSDDELALHWAYAIGGKDAESSFEVYDWDGNMVYATSGKPIVGELCRFYTDCVDVVDEVEEPLLMLYPNPASNSFTVESQVKEIRVFNAVGQLMHQGTRNVVDVSTWPDGMYFVRVVDENDAVSTVKFIKE